MSSQNRTGSRRKTITTISSLAIAGALVLTGCSPEVEKGWLPTERGTTSNTDRIMDLWVNSWIAALVVGIITWGLIVWCLVAYRRRKGTVGFPRQTSFNLPLEVFYLTIPLFMVVVFFYFTDRDQQAIDNRSEPADVVVDVRGKQWAWDFNYKAGDVIEEDVYEAGVQTNLTGNTIDKEQLPTLYLPVNKSVDLELNARDVIHSFWVPAFLQKRDMIPGKTNYIRFTPTKEGTYDGKCAELCGEYHSEMLFRVKVVSESEFQAHMDELREAGNTGLLGVEYDRNPNVNEIK
ncbi:MULTISPECIES: aa3-type cytochrome oxidase subunit II [Micrococcaceae]|uniref:aa3-type cytochrome oxidase subunit II n=1 Tax=Micrococcaceae TaxID=1268 RepID=UPI0007D01054|nr:MULTISPECIES: cytochrome c oxidase subunit II [Micrococcaceae]MBA4101995.1 cytochrome c oxidase subunit II [Arthrobacter sp.]MDV2979280.1 cytochrome c oxidase subunit II [Actinomycetes bacterium ARC8]WHP57496.1 cytochrome c oxidase subunit II [Arthrobacter sp. KFRI-F3372]NSX34860.1 cytochrome c oxidase subunit II [Pseudarthrobacter oxydans]OAE01818.1 cytochrome C oxidase subunit II [Arthrobacter sp. OY3WO11]